MGLSLYIRISRALDIVRKMRAKTTHFLAVFSFNRAHLPSFVMAGYIHLNCKDQQTTVVALL
jgi:hypothetical protein